MSGLYGENYPPQTSLGIPSTKKSSEAFDDWVMLLDGRLRIFQDSSKGLCRYTLKINSLLHTQRCIAKPTPRANEPLIFRCFKISLGCP